MTEPTKDADRAAALEWYRAANSYSPDETRVKALAIFRAQAREEGRIAGETAMMERAAKRIAPLWSEAAKIIRALQITPKGDK